MCTILSKKYINNDISWYFWIYFWTAIFENQKIILLDEPTNALDEDAVQLIYKIIREEKSRGATIIVATHHKEDLKEVCDVILKIAEGKIVEENENK